jgi:hypothetical protein
MENLKNKKKHSIATIIGLIVGLFACITVYQLFFKSPALDKTMMNVASEINKSCPIMVDTETRLDNTAAISKTIFQYNYTLVNMESADIDTLEMKKMLEPNIVNFVTTNPQMKYLRDHKTTMNYYYKDKKGIYICTISVSPEKYE